MSYFYLYDIQYLFFLAPALLLSLFASLLLKYWYNKYLNTPNRQGTTGLQLANIISSQEGWAISFSAGREDLGDNYNPVTKNLTLSAPVASTASIASVAITAHELGHVQQDFGRSLLLQVRSLIVPAVSIGSSLGYFLIIIGLILSVAGLAWVGVILFSLTLVFSLLTLPIEIDASRRALSLLRRYQILTESEIGGAKKVLTAASLTYVAGLVTSLLNVIYFVLRVSQATGRRRG